MKNRTTWTLPTLWAILCVLAVSPSIGAPAPEQPIHCDLSGNTHCKLIPFDRSQNRLAETILGIRPLTPLESAEAWAINQSKVLYTGTIIMADFPSATCPNEDFKVTLLAKETSNVIIYAPVDISEYCLQAVNRDDAKDVDGYVNQVILVVPVQVIWAQVFYYPGNVLDPTRKGPTSLSVPPAYCGAPVANNTIPGGIQPCDYRTSHAYASWIGRFYNAFTQPGTSQGSISITPAVGKPVSPTNPLGLKGPSESITFDVQLYGSTKLGYGWLGMPLMIEKGTANGADLGSITGGISYDIPFSRFRPNTGYTGNTNGIDSSPSKQLCGDTFGPPPNPPPPNSLPVPPANPGLSTVVPPVATVWLNANCPSRFSVRPPEFRVVYGPELSAGPPHDINLVGSTTVRLPVVIDFLHQPSAISLYPTIGVEAGTHELIHPTSTGDIVPDRVLRMVTGADFSLRIPYYFTHAFLGDTPITIDFGWRARYLYYKEPFVDYVSGNLEALTTQQRSYWRGALTIPVSTAISIKLTVQHGGLPPDFKYLGTTLSLGLAFGNPGHSEH